MTAVQIDHFGEPEVFATVEVPRPVPGPGQLFVLVF